MNYTGYSDSMWSSGHPKYHENKQSFNLFSANVNVQTNNVGHIKINFFISQPKHVVEAQKNRLIEMILLSTQNKCLN